MKNTKKQSEKSEKSEHYVISNHLIIRSKMSIKTEDTQKYSLNEYVMWDHPKLED